MKNFIIASGLIVTTVTGIAFYDELIAAQKGPGPVRPAPVEVVEPPPTADPVDKAAAATIDAARNSPRIDVVFALDTTGSMSGMIQAAKEKIWSIASTMATAQVAPTIRVGLVAYRDRGDAYVTRTFDLTEDLDNMYTELMRFRAAGGGDGPESVNQALHEAVTTMSWSDDPNAYKVVFLVGDAPAHMDYDNDVRYPETVREASRRGIVINTILCGTDRTAKHNWQKIAGLGQGQYFQVNQNGGAVAVATPYDKRMAKLSRELDQTRLAYGSRQERVAVEKKRSRVDAVMGETSVASAARRAAFNVSASGKSNLLRDKDLVADVTAGKVAVESLAPAQLPAALQDKSPEQVKAELAARADRRATLEQQIRDLSKQRQAYIRDEIKTSGKSDSLDDKIFATIRRQAADKGLEYEADATRY